MAGKILKGLAIAAGAGLGIKLTASRKRRSENAAPSAQSVLERLDRIEARMSALETDAGLDQRIRQHIASEVPAILESILAPRIEDLRTRLHNEAEERMDETLAEFERSVGDAVATRLSVLEKSLVDQSSVITALSQKAIDTDGNLQSLISAVENLCQRTEAPTAKEPTFLDLPFQAQLDDAMERPAIEATQFVRPR
jgi:hypothetical protein